MHVFFSLGKVLSLTGRQRRGNHHLVDGIRAKCGCGSFYTTNVRQSHVNFLGSTPPLAAQMLVFVLPLDRFCEDEVPTSMAFERTAFAPRQVVPAIPDDFLSILYSMLYL